MTSSTRSHIALFGICFFIAALAVVLWAPQKEVLMFLGCLLVVTIMMATHRCFREISFYWKLLFGFLSVMLATSYWKLSPIPLEFAWQISRQVLLSIAGILFLCKLFTQRGEI